MPQVLINITVLATVEGTPMARVKNKAEDIIKMIRAENERQQPGWLAFDGMGGKPLHMSPEAWRRIGVLDEGQIDVPSNLEVGKVIPLPA